MLMQPFSGKQDNPVINSTDQKQSQAMTKHDQRKLVDRLIV
jgi:hypothetical protein